jgi:hypothetical protein
LGNYEIALNFAFILEIWERGFFEWKRIFWKKAFLGKKKFLGKGISGKKGVLRKKNFRKRDFRGKMTIFGGKKWRKKTIFEENNNFWRKRQFW